MPATPVARRPRTSRPSSWRSAATCGPKAARDFLETAEIVAGLDLVITIDTAMAHLAGSLGVPTWILLPAPPDTDWRWLRDRCDIPSYPSASLLRQPSPGNWTG